MKSLSSFTHPYVIPNLYAFLFSVEHNRRYFKERWSPDNIRPHWPWDDDRTFIFGWTIVLNLLLWSHILLHLPRSYCAPSISYKPFCCSSFSPTLCNGMLYCVLWRCWAFRDFWKIPISSFSAGLFAGCVGSVSCIHKHTRTHTHTHTHTHTQCSQCYEAHQRQWAWQVSAFCVHAWRQISRDTKGSRLGLISAAFTASTTLPAGQATQAGHKLKVNMQSKLTIFTFLCMFLVLFKNLLSK